MKIVYCYAFIMLGIVAWTLLIPTKKKINPKLMELTTIFGGAFLFATCFLQLVPHLFFPHLHEHAGMCSHDHNHGLFSILKPGVWVLVGFVVQLLLETLTRGIEHGHNHADTCTHSHHDHACPITGLLIGLSLHAFMEGMPLTFGSGEVHWGLLYGIILHNIPVSLILVTLFINHGYSTAKSAGLLLLFAVMTPLGSIFNRYLLVNVDNIEQPVMGIVIGILLHVSVSILFDHDNNRYSPLKLLLVIVAFVLAYMVPGCQH
ncbi:MAG: ZIP family metal transporter [Bacteroidales bacterium]|nr:ZIP family metal transporter [Bacteroidales bacterium]